jgi:hypothetical protein
VKLGIIAGCVCIFLLFGAGALQHGSSSTINQRSVQITSLLLEFLPGYLALAIAAVLAYYAGLSTPEAQSSEGGRDGLIAGSITMLLFWLGQTLFVIVTGLGSPQGLGLDDFLKTRLLAAVLFFVVGGALGWGGSRAAARRARSILAAPTSTLLSLTGSGIEKPVPIPQAAPPEQNATADAADWHLEGDEMASLEAPADASEYEHDR